jgi:hypothetical protein
MKNKKAVLIAGLLIGFLVIGAVAAIGVTSVYAQSPSTILPHGRGPGDGRGPGMGQAELDAAAQALGMTTDELSTALQGGKALEQLATEKGVDLQKVTDAINAAHREEIRTRIQQDLSDGMISQDKANWLLEGLNKGFLDEPGLGFGLRSPHGQNSQNGQGQGFSPLPGLTPPAAPTQQSSG